MSEKLNLVKVFSIFKRYRIFIAVTLLYAVLAVLFTWPLAEKITDFLPGGTTDTLVHYWNGWWAAKALSLGESPFFTTYLFYPNGIDLVYHNFAWWSICLWFLVKPLVGGIAAYNLVFLFNLVLCGLSVYLLGLELTKNKWAAFICGMIYMLWPARLAQLDHPNLISTHWIPLFVLFLGRAIKNRCYRNALIAGILAVLIGYTRWQQLIAAGIAGGIYAVFLLAQERINLKRLMPVVLVGVIAFCGLYPYLFMLLRQQQDNPAELIVSGEETIMQTDVLAYLTPGPLHPVFKAWTDPAYDRYYDDRANGRKFSAFLGFSVLFLSVIGLKNRSSYSWIITALLFIILALGPLLRLKGTFYPGLPMPYHVLVKITLFRLMRVPDRYNVFLALPVSISAAFGVTYLWERIQLTRIKHLTLSLITAMILFEYLPGPAPLQSTQLSKFFANVSKESSEKAILNLPIDSQKSKQYMFAQTVHGHPILQGKTARFPQGVYSFLDGNPLLNSLRQFDEISPKLKNVGGQLAELAKNGVGYLVLNKNLASKDRLAHWQRYFITSPRYEDRWVAVYSTEPVQELDFTIKTAFDPAIGVVKVITSTQCLNPGGVWAADIGWGITDSIDEDLDVRFMLIDENGEPLYEESFPDGLNSTWSSGSLVWKYYSIETPTTLDLGEYSIILDLVDASTGNRHGEPVNLGVVNVQTGSCEYPLPDGTRIDALYGDELRLLGYKASQDNDLYKITLYWRSEKRMEHDYKIFVHIFDPLTNIPAAQNDAMPSGWGYPTSFWGIGDNVDDKITISIADIPNGVYGVAIGVYDPSTLDRLPVFDVEGNSYPDGRLILKDETVVHE